MRVLIVGGGLTGAHVARQLSRSSIITGVSILERNATLGGRMQLAHGAEVGAQYITRHSDGQGGYQHPAVYAELIESKLLVDFDAEASVRGLHRSTPDAPPNYIAPLGLQSVVEHLASAPKVDVCLNTPVLCVTRTAQGARIESAAPLPKAAQGLFDAVVVTAPVPHLQGLAEGEGHANLLQEVAARFSGAKYSQRYTWVAEVEVPSSQGDQWPAHYFREGPVRFIVRDNVKRGYPVGGGVTARVVAHSSVPFADSAAEEELSPAGIEEALRSDTLAKLGEGVRVVSAHLFHWDVSQALPGAAGNTAAATCFGELPSQDEGGDCPVLITGDAFASSGNMDGCLEAAEATACRLISRLTERVPSKM